MLPDIVNNNVAWTVSSLAGNRVREFDEERGITFLRTLGYDDQSNIMMDYKRLVANIQLGKDSDKKRAEFTARVMLATYNIVKISEVDIFYIEEHNRPLYKRCRSKEALSDEVSLWYQILFGFRANIQDATKFLVAGITSFNTMQCIERRYIWIVGNYCWDKMTANIYKAEDLPAGTRVFGRMFDTDSEDEEIFKIPEFTQEQVNLMYFTYRLLRTKPYEEWDDEYHFQCFKDWSMNRPDIEFGMFTVLALPFMWKLPRGAIFNVGEGHNGKSVLIGLAASILGKNNTSFVSGNNLSSWDNLVDLQTTFFNCPSETKVDFLKDDTAVFKSLSAHETIAMRKKYGDASIPVIGDFPMVFNLNKLPDFGSDAAAILSRMFVNDFDCDFEATGKAVKDYARKTFLKDPDVMPKLVGMIFAFAYYYNSEEHPWEPKAPMIERREAIRETATPHARYLYWFTKFFSGFKKITTLKEDYIKFGKAEGEDYDTDIIKLKELPFKRFSRSSLRDGTTVYKESDKGFPVKRFIMEDNTYIRKYMGSMNLQEVNYSGDSVVYTMMVDYLKREAEYKDMLKLAGIEKTQKEIEKKVLQDMFKDIESEQTCNKDYHRESLRREGGDGFSR